MLELCRSLITSDRFWRWLASSLQLPSRPVHERPALRGTAGSLRSPLASFPLSSAFSPDCGLQASGSTRLSDPSRLTTLGAPLAAQGRRSEVGGEGSEAKSRLPSPIKGRAEWLRSQSGEAWRPQSGEKAEESREDASGKRSEPAVPRGAGRSCAGRGGSRRELVSQCQNGLR